MTRQTLTTVSPGLESPQRRDSVRRKTPRGPDSGTHFPGFEERVHQGPDGPLSTPCQSQNLLSVVRPSLTTQGEGSPATALPVALCLETEALIVLLEPPGETPPVETPLLPFLVPSSSQESPPLKDHGTPDTAHSRSVSLYGGGLHTRVPHRLGPRTTLWVYPGRESLTGRVLTPVQTDPHRVCLCIYTYRVLSCNLPPIISL